MNIIQINENKKQYIDLLLLADEQESMIDRYLERGDMFVLEDNGTKAVCIITDEGGGVCELKNIAVVPGSQGQGYGKRLINYLIFHYSTKYTQIIVGTGDVPSTTGFYKSCGFEYTHRVENFFIDNYEHLIYEDGMLLKDMIYFKRCIKMDFIIRVAQQSDVVELRDLYKGTVLNVNRQHYSQAEVDDWASCGDNLSNIEEMIKTHYFIVAVDILSQIVGFSSITPQGYLHSMFVHKDFQSKGIATMLLKEVERYALASEIKLITSEVSLTARPFFEKYGYVVEKEQKRQANKLKLTNFYMLKSIKIVNIRQLNKSEYDNAITLSLSVFTECGTSDFDIQGLETFKRFIYNKELMNELTIFGAFDDDRLIGIIGIKNNGAHISLFFIHPKFHCRGIGRELFNAAYANPKGIEITVNSSSYAVKFYESLGFSKISEEQETDGLKYTPMKKV